MIIRKATAADLDAMQQLYQETIRAVNARDYAPVEIEVWASGHEAVAKRFGEQEFFVAETGGEITGFSSLREDGYIDFIFVHKDFQALGIATKLLKTVEESAVEQNIRELHSDVSITARPFFKKRGFRVEREYAKEFNGLKFKNTIMKKGLFKNI